MKWAFQKDFFFKSCTKAVLTSFQAVLGFYLFICQLYLLRGRKAMTRYKCNKNIIFDIWFCNLNVFLSVPRLIRRSVAQPVGNDSRIGPNICSMQTKSRENRRRVKKNTSDKGSIYLPRDKIRFFRYARDRYAIQSTFKCLIREIYLFYRSHTRVI